MNDLVKPIDKKFNLPASNVMAAIVPKTMDEVWRLSQAVALSGLAPKEMKEPERIMVAVLHGLELGLKPMQAIQRIAVINGRPSLWGDAALGLVRASGLMEWIKESVEGAGDARVATCTTLRRGDPEPVTRTFSVADAKVAGLWKKAGPWTTHPDRMLQMRARGFNLRDVYPDPLGGMYLAEELQGETIDAAPAIPTPPTPPKLADASSVVIPADAGTTPSLGTGGKIDPAIAQGPNRSERGEFADKNGVEIPLGALTDFDAFHKALDSCPTLDALNAMFEALTNNMHAPDDLEEAQNRLREVASKFAMEE
jgi:hypothetical protein